MLPFSIFFNNLVYSNPEGVVSISTIASVFVNAELCCRYCLAFRNLREVESEFLVVPSLVRKILVSFNYDKEKEERKNSWYQLWIFLVFFVLLIYVRGRTFSSSH